MLIFVCVYALCARLHTGWRIGQTEISIQSWGGGGNVILECKCTGIRRGDRYVTVFICSLRVSFSLRQLEGVSLLYYGAAACV